MKRAIQCALCATLVATGVHAGAQEPAHSSALFTPSAIARAVASMPPVDAQVDPRRDWSQVMTLRASTEIVVRTNTASTRGRVISADDRLLVIEDSESPGRPMRRIARVDVDEVMKWTGRRGSLIGAAVGAGGGFLLGVIASLNLALKDCGGSCSDERFFIGASLVGLPIGGGLAGYYLAGSRRSLTTVYLRP
jgi:hypothetical protein